VEHNSKRLRIQSASGTIDVEGGKEDDEEEEEKKEKRRRRRTSKMRKKNLVVHKVNTGLESVNEKRILIPSTAQFWKPLCI
jgi:hypothetical protein